jgi:quercetin dioxygenase-like cupin family protein
MSDQERQVEFTLVQDAATMADFEDGRVRPVAVLKSTGANVVVFAFTAGAELREHTAQYPVLLQSLEGTLDVQISGQGFQITPGDLLHIEPHVAHSVTAEDNARLQLTVLMIDSPGPSGVPLVDDLGIAEREGGSGR